MIKWRFRYWYLLTELIKKTPHTYTSCERYVIVKASCRVEIRFDRDSCPKPWQLSKAVTVVQSRDSCPKQWQLSKTVTVVQSRDSCPKPWQLSKAVTVVQSRESCPKQWQLSKAMTVVQRLDSCPKPWQLSKAMTVVQSRDSCPKPWQLSKAVTVVQNRERIWVGILLSISVTKQTDVVHNSDNTYQVSYFSACSTVCNFGQSVAPFRENRDIRVNTWQLVDKSV
jgi:hypothetical protein